MSDGKTNCRQSEQISKGTFGKKTFNFRGILDEEAINLVQFQHAFQANSKVITTVDQLLDVVINLVR